MTLDRQRTRELVQALLRARNMREGGGILENTARDSTAIGDESYGKPVPRGMGFMSAPEEATTGSNDTSQSHKLMKMHRGVPTRDQLAFIEAPITLSQFSNPQGIYSRPLSVNAAGIPRPRYRDYLWGGLSPPYGRPNGDNLSFPPLIYQGRKLTEAEKDACHDQFYHDNEQCYKNYSYSPEAWNRCHERAKIIRDLCLRGEKEISPWNDVDEDGVRFPKPGKGRKRK